MKSSKDIQELLGYCKRIYDDVYEYMKSSKIYESSEMLKRTYENSKDISADSVLIVKV